MFRFFPVFILLSFFFSNLTAQEPFGVGTHVNESRFWPILADHGVQWLRIDLSWNRIQPSPQKWNFAEIDQALHIADSLNLKVLAILGYSPSWASGSSDSKTVPRESFMDEWLQYVDSTVSRYQKQVTAWEIWNEPDHHFFFKTTEDSWAWNHHPEASPAQRKRLDYVWLQQKTMTLLRKKYGSALWVTTSGFSLGGRYDEDFYPYLIDSTNLFAMYNTLNVHGYGYPTQKHLHYLMNLVDQYKRKFPSQQAWLTEHGITEYRKLNISENQALTFMFQNIATVLSRGFDKFFWFRLTPTRDYATLIDSLGKPTLFMEAYGRFIHHWKRATQIAPWNGPHGTRGAVAQFSDHKALVFWCDTPHQISLPEMSHLMDLRGQKLSPYSFPCTEQPLLAILKVNES